MSKNFGVNKYFGPKRFGPKVFLTKMVWSKKISVQNKICSKKIGQNRVSYSWDIPDLDKFRQDKCCLDKCYHDSWHLLKMVPGTYFLSLVKLRLVTAEIFLIWTNVARTNVAWTNVVMAVEICSRLSWELTFKVWSKSGQ